MMPKSPLPTGMGLIRDARLSQFTTFRLGGPCPALLPCRTPGQVHAAVAACRRDGVPFRFMGGGSNLLVSDRGVDEVVIRFESGPETLRFNGASIEADGGVPFDALASAALEAGIAGFEFATGIPGTLGGAIAGNAGAFGEQIGDRIDEVRVLAPDGSEHAVAPEAMSFSYRASGVADRKWIILSARMRGAPGDRGRLCAERDRILAFRRDRHPDWRTVATAPVGSSGRYTLRWTPPSLGRVALRVSASGAETTTTGGFILATYGPSTSRTMPVTVVAGK